MTLVQHISLVVAVAGLPPTVSVAEAVFAMVSVIFVLPAVVLVVAVFLKAVQ
jgi:hypothetical protein